MKFVHLGDLHLGKSLFDYDLIDDQKYLLDQVIEIAKKREVHHILLAGDIYDKAIPSEAAVELFDYFIRQMVQNDMQAFVISGNHDSDERLNFGSSLFESGGIHIASKFSGEIRRYSLQDTYGKINLYLLPFVKASQVKHYFPDEEITNYDDAFRAVIKHAQVNQEERNILVAHQFVAGKGTDPKLGGSESIAVQNVGTVEKIGYDCFDAFDYAALGHIHSGQHVGRNEVRYAGSLMKYSLSEVHSEKKIPVVELKEKGTVTIDFEELHPRRDMRHLKGKMEKLLDKENIISPEDFIYVTLTDDDVITDAMSIFQQVYPNTIKIDYDNAHTREIAEPDLQNVVDHKSFDELIREFYQTMYGCEISEDEMKMMMAAAREAGVSHETD